MQQMIEEQSHKQLYQIPLLNVQVLNLSHNFIAHVPKELESLTKLNTLILSHNLITHFPKLQLPFLQHLELAHNKLLETDFSTLQLVSLNVAHNDFSKYQHLPSLQKLTLSWFALIDQPTFQKNLLTSETGAKLREKVAMNIVEFVATFSVYTSTVLIKAIQYDEAAIINDLCEAHTQSLHELANPQPLFFAAKMNSPHFSSILRYFSAKSNLLVLLLFWSCFKLDLETAQILVAYGVWGVWDEKLDFFQSRIGIIMKNQLGDTPLHTLFRRNINGDHELTIQGKLVELLRRVQNVNQKNSLKYAPIHLPLQTPSLKQFLNCEGFNFNKRMGKNKDSLLHQAAQMGLIKAIQALGERVDVFLLNVQNKTVKFRCSSSLSILKYIRKLERQQLLKFMQGKYNHLVVTQKQNSQDFHLNVTMEDDLYKLLLGGDMILQDKLIVVVILNLLQFKQLFKVKFQSERLIKPINFINACFFKYSPEVNKFKHKLGDLLRRNHALVNQKPRETYQDQLQRLSRALAVNLEPTQDLNEELYEMLNLYSQLGFALGGYSNRTSLIDYEYFQQKRFHSAQFRRERNKNYGRVSKSPLPMKYIYENYLTCRRQNTDSFVEPERSLNQVNQTERKQFIQ